MPEYSEIVLKMGGRVSKTDVRNEKGQITSTVYTYDLFLENCTGHDIGCLIVDADIRIMECGAARPLIGKGECSCCFDPADVDVMVHTQSQVCSCNCECACNCNNGDHVEIDCKGVHIKLRNVLPGKSMVKLVVPLFNEEPEEPFRCIMLPALFACGIVQSVCDEQRVVYQNSILIGEQPHDVECEEDSEDCCSNDCSCEE